MYGKLTNSNIIHKLSQIITLKKRGKEKGAQGNRDKNPYKLSLKFIKVDDFHTHSQFQV